MIEKIIRDPNRVIIFDSTLRDGFQAPGVNVGPEERLEVAKLLANMNVDIIEAGFPISNQENFNSVRTIALAVKGPVICGLSRTRLRDIDKCWEAIEPAKYTGGARIHTFIATSDIHMKYKLEKTPEEVITEIRQGVRRAKEYTADVEFSAEDATRSNFNFLMRVVLEAIDAGATTINLPDTVGYMKPPEYARLISRAKNRIDRYIGSDQVVLSVHCHNDMGSAVENSLEGARKGGARQIEAVVNGIGERAGNAALEEIIASLLSRPDFYQANGRPLLTRVDPSFTYELSKLVERVSGIIVPPNKAIVGKNAFKHESGIHADGVLKNPLTYEIMQAETFGINVARIVIGAESGRASIVNRAAELGFKIKDESTFTTRVKEYANSIRREVSDIELEKIAARCNGEQLVDKFKLLKADFYGHDHESHSTVKIKIGSQKHTVDAVGNGPIGAGINAIKKAAGINLDFENFLSKSLNEGAGAKGSVSLTVKNHIKITSYKEDYSITLAAVKAYVAALNTIDRSMQRKKDQAE